MPRSHPHPLALLSLLPLNKRARLVLDHPENDHLVSTVEDDDEGTLRVIDIGFHIGSKSRYTLATIGRCGDIIVEGAGISRIQCSFEIHDGNKREIMLQDRSSNNTTQLLGETAMPFEPGRPHRRVLVDPGVNVTFGFGGAACDLYKFDIIWHARRELDIPKLLDYREDHPRQTRTILVCPLTVRPSGPVTRIHTPGGYVHIRYSKREKLGCGTFGEVWKVADADTGAYLAVKQIRRPSLLSQEYVMLKREVETLSRISHKNIIAIRAAQSDAEHLNIFMDLKPGNVDDLVRKDVFINDNSLTKPFLHQMLQALDYLAYNGIIHRDVKPENILYTTSAPGSYEYQLADFGLANLAAVAQTYAGTAIYMAPELETGPQTPQTPKMDVWSLFVTLTYVLDMAGFRSKPLYSAQLRIKAVQDAANTDLFRPLQPMVIIDPSRRASAADMLEQVYDGEGRTTPHADEVRLEPRKRAAATEKRMRNAVEVVERRDPVATARRKRARAANRAAQRRMPDSTRPDSSDRDASAGTTKKQHETNRSHEYI